MEVDCSQKLPVLDIDQVNESYVGSESLRVLASDLWRPSDKLSSETHATGKSWTKLIYSQTWKVDRELGNEHEGNASTMPVDPASSKGCSILSTSSSEVEAAIPKEEPCIDGAGHLENKELHFFSDFQNVKRGGCAEGQGGRQESKNAICKTGNYGPTLVDVEGNKLDKTKGSMDTLSSDNSELSNASNFHGEDYEPHGNFYHPTDIECREGSELIGGNSQDNESRLLTIHKIEESDKQGELRSPGHGYLQEHQTLPLWVKWRGKWQAGFRCPRVDCPLSTLKAKPTHQRKKYISIFFPRTRMYSWVDMLLVCPINKFPEPLAYGTHRRWRKLVKDLSTPRRHVMQKLALAVLNICEQLHTEAVVEDTHRSTTWKEFAKESSHGGGYSSLGKMLLKLQNMILPRYLNKDWLKSSFDFWVQRCCAAQSAESIEILTEELVESVLWSKVDKLWNAPVQPELSPEWKTWKQEAMSCFLISNSQSSFKRVEQINSDISVDGEPKICRKRLKLDVHPHETSISHVEEVSNHQMLSRINRRIIDSRLHNSQGLTELASNCESHKMVAPPQVGTATGSNFLVDRLKDTTRGVEDAELIHNKVRSSKEPILHASDLWNNSNKYRQCLAFVETKGRQCGRWANDGDIYCCVHLNNHFVRKDPHLLNHTPLVEAPMCQGTTTHGTKCKHRSRYGSTFCKKHLFQGNQSSRTADFLLMSSTDLPKRKQQEVEVLESISNLNASYSWDETLLRDAANSTQESHILISEELDEKNCIMKQTKLHNSLPTPVKDISSNLPQCIGHYSQSNVGDCQEFARWHTLYCEKHIPKFLKRARSGKSRIISKDVFISLLKSCSSRNEKLTLHQACELLYRFMKSGLSRQKIVSSGEHAACIIAEASKDLNVGEYLLKLVSCEREKILRLCGLNSDKDQQISSTEINSLSTMNQDLEMTMKCKRCAQEFSGDDMLCRHLIEVHKKEVQQFFRGYACMICMDLFSNHKVLETHVIAKHGVQLLEHSVSLRCMSCSSLFVNLEEFWQHVFSSHSTELRMLNLNQCSWPVEEGEVVHFLSKRRNYFLKRGRVSHSRFWKNFRSAFTFKKHCSLDTLIDVHGSTSMSHLKPKSYSSPSEMAEFGRLSQPDCSIVAEALFSKLKKAKVWPSNLDKNGNH